MHNYYFIVLLFFRSITHIVRLLNITTRINDEVESVWWQVLCVDFCKTVTTFMNIFKRSLLRPTLSVRNVRESILSGKLKTKQAEKILSLRHII